MLGRELGGSLRILSGRLCRDVLRDPSLVGVIRFWLVLAVLAPAPEVAFFARVEADL